MTEPVRLRANSTYYPYVYLFRTAKRSLKRLEIETEKAEPGTFFTMIEVCLFCPLTLEAYLNHIGDLHLPPAEWEVLERASPAQKATFLGSRLGFPVDWGAAPFQSFRQMFDFRNAVAHAKTQTAGAIVTEDEEGSVRWPVLSWQATCNIETARKWVADTSAIVHLIHRATTPGFENLSPLLQNPFAISSRGEAEEVVEAPNPGAGRKTGRNRRTR